MNQNEADSVKDLAKLVVEALEGVTQRKCPDWMTHTKQKHNRGEGSYTTFTCETCSDTGKVKWTWEPRVGEWCVTGSCVRLIDDNFLVADMPWGHPKIHKDYPIPILHWETLEEILEGVGYWLQIGRPHAGGLAKTQCMINAGDEANSRICVRGKSRQEAVCRAIIALGKKLREEKDG